MTLPEGHHFGVEPVEMLLRERLVDVPPLHVGVGGLVAHHEFVLGRTPRELPRADYERAAAGESPFPALDGVLQQLRRAQIQIGRAHVAEPLLLQAMMAWPYPRIRN